jgi:hypothetical protein
VARRATFGNIRRLPSGRYQARFTDPAGRKVPAPMTFDTKLDAQAWLATMRADLVRGAWMPADHATTFGVYAATCTSSPRAPESSCVPSSPAR